jgi:hypothetical protein
MRFVDKERKLSEVRPPTHDPSVPDNLLLARDRMTRELSLEKSAQIEPVS